QAFKNFFLPDLVVCGFPVMIHAALFLLIKLKMDQEFLLPVKWFSSMPLQERGSQVFCSARMRLNGICSVVVFMDQVSTFS
ncbi:hypothetical protein, partial [Akkermansia sp.]|uniref:hypothetical protein n=1 Tax=Akkermansia sp. TaxID=1872421 RepID=UPI003AB0D708